MVLRSEKHPRIPTADEHGQPNGWLVPIYNVNDEWLGDRQAPEQVYLTVIAPNKIKGPHLHLIRRGLFTCIRGNIRVVARVDGEYEVYYSGEDHGFRSVEIPAGVPAALQNLGSSEALVLNMPCPAWTPDMNDEHSADFSDFDFST